MSGWFPSENAPGAASRRAGRVTRDCVPLAVRHQALCHRRNIFRDYPSRGVAPGAPYARSC